MITFAVRYEIPIMDETMLDKKYIKELKALKKELETISSKRAKVLRDSTASSEEEYYSGDYKTYTKAYEKLTEEYESIRKRMARIVAENRRSFAGLRGCGILSTHNNTINVLSFEDEFGIKYSLLIMDSNMELCYPSLRINDDIVAGFIGNRYDFDERSDKSAIRVIDESSFLVADNRGNSISISIGWHEELPKRHFFIALVVEGGYVVFREKVELKDK